MFMRSMFRKLLLLMITGLLSVNLCGCIAMMATMAETAKEKRTVNLSYGDTLDVVKKVIKAESIEFIGADIKPAITEVKGRCADEKTARIFISKLSDTQTNIAVRVGTSEAGKEDAKRIIKAITEYADLVNQESKAPAESKVEE